MTTKHCGVTLLITEQRSSHTAASNTLWSQIGGYAAAALAATLVAILLAAVWLARPTTQHSGLPGAGAGAQPAHVSAPANGISGGVQEPAQGDASDASTQTGPLNAGRDRGRGVITGGPLSGFEMRNTPGRDTKCPGNAEC
jgi:hypothetical protein